MELFGILMSSFLSSFYVLVISPLSDVGLVEIFFHSEGFHFVLRHNGWLFWLTSKLCRSACPCSPLLPNTGVMDTHHYAWLWCGSWGSEHRSLCWHSRHLLHWAVSSASADSFSLLESPGFNSFWFTSSPGNSLKGNKRQCVLEPNMNDDSLGTDSNDPRYHAPSNTFLLWVWSGTLI